MRHDLPKKDPLADAADRWQDQHGGGLDRIDLAHPQSRYAAWVAAGRPEGPWPPPPDRARPPARPSRKRKSPSGPGDTGAEDGHASGLLRGLNG